MSLTSSQKTSSVKFDISHDILSKLEINPGSEVTGNLLGHAYTAKIIIPNYSELIQKFYKPQLEHAIDYYNTNLKLPLLFKNFGICISFKEPVEIHLHSLEMELESSAKQLISKYGALILYNVHLDSEMRDMGHRNRFPQLNFHIDRNPHQDTRYSLYTRNPFDEEQKQPRTSMTIFIPYLVAYLQAMKEGKGSIADKDGLITRSELYSSIDIPELLNSVVLPHTWDQPEGVGEISMIDNANILHASYYPNEANKGYRIGVRYVS